MCKLLLFKALSSSCGLICCRMKSSKIVDSSAFLTDSLDYEYKTLHNTIAYSLAIFQSSSVSAVNLALINDKNLAKLK